MGKAASEMWSFRSQTERGTTVWAWVKTWTGMDRCVVVAVCVFPGAFGGQVLCRVFMYLKTENNSCWSQNSARKWKLPGFFYANNEPKSALARNPGDCRDNKGKLAKCDFTCWQKIKGRRKYFLRPNKVLKWFFSVYRFVAFGNVKINSDPTPWVLITSMFSPCAWMISFTIASPSPVPFLSFPLERSDL